MDNEIKNDIFYRPDLHVDKDYASSGRFDRSTSEENTFGTYREPLSELKKLYEDAKLNEANLIKIKGVLGALPKSVSRILEPINDFLFLQTELELNEINDLIIQEEQDKSHGTYEKTYCKKEDRTDAVDAVHHESSEVTNFVDDEGFVWGESEIRDITITVTKAKSSAEQAKQQYLQDSTDLKEEYLMQINNAIEDYVYPLTVYMSEIGISMKSYLDQEYDALCITGVPNNARHLHDIITRNDVIMKEIALLLEKTHSTYKTINVFTAWDVASQQRIRYYSEEYQPDFTTYLEVKKNDLLTESRQLYDDKYAMAKINAYRHLYSAVELTKAICEKDLESKSAKCYLLSKDVNIYATTKYDTVKVDNSATKGVAGTITSAPGTTGSNGITGSSAAIAEAAAKTSAAAGTDKATSTSPKANASSEVINPDALFSNIDNMINGCFSHIKI